MTSRLSLGACIDYEREQARSAAADAWRAEQRYEAKLTDEEYLRRHAYPPTAEGEFPLLYIGMCCCRNCRTTRHVNRWEWRCQWCAHDEFAGRASGKLDAVMGAMA